VGIIPDLGVALGRAADSAWFGAVLIQNEEGFRDLRRHADFQWSRSQQPIGSVRFFKTSEQ